ncbi:MAG: DUF6607 family protein [Myxococcota bacterium]
MAAGLVGLAGCATGGGSTAAPSRPGPPAPWPAAEAEAAGSATCDPERDRAAILAMAGDYEVEFRFEETVPLAEGYALREPYRTSAIERVRVLDEGPHRVSLQHLLVFGGDADAHVIKHWRQDWTFEDRELLEFRGEGRFVRRTVPAEQARCAWSQAVFGVTDEPRYEGLGRWRHHAGVSSWTAGHTWRPLPRREYSKRDDYDVLVAVNRHTLTPEGWAHEQLNTKLVLDEPPQALVRELGTNRYVRLDEGDLPAARRYWDATADYWQHVRAQWRRLLADHDRFSLRAEVDGERLHDHLFPLAEREADPDQIRGILHRFVSFEGK